MSKRNLLPLNWYLSAMSNKTLFEASFFDTHSHFDFDVFSLQADDELQRATARGVKKILIPAIAEKNWERVRLLSAQFPDVIYYALGIHPHYLHSVNEQSFASLAAALIGRDDHCVAIGECGLDAMISTPMAEQQDIFLQHLALAEQCQLPVVIHSRKTHALIAKFLRQYPMIPGGVIHAFSGSYQQAMELIQLGFKIGVGGTITYPRANKTRTAIRQLPLNALVLETDAPDMPICGRQGMPNHPQYLLEIFHCLTDLRTEPPAVLAEALWVNSHQLFNLPLS